MPDTESGSLSSKKGSKSGMSSESNIMPNEIIHRQMSLENIVFENANKLKDDSVDREFEIDID